MKFSFDDDQNDVRLAVRDALRERIPSSAVRKAWTAAHDHDGVAWSVLQELGLPGVIVDEAHRGAGGGIIDVALSLEECGYFAVPEPVVETIVMAPIALALHGSAEQQDEWLPRLASGAAIVATCLGDTPIVADGIRADAILVRQGTQLHWVPRAKVHATAVNGTDPSRRLAVCTFDLDEGTQLTQDASALQHIMDIGAAATAAVLVGVAARLIDMTREHLLERKQFDRVIGSFQALKHRLADVAVQTEAARSLTWYALYTLSEGLPEASIAASHAKAAANDAASKASHASLQLHGGIGFTWDHDLHLWLQRGRSLESAFGSTAAHRERTGASLLFEGSAHDA